MIRTDFIKFHKKNSQSSMFLKLKGLITPSFIKKMSFLSTFKNHQLHLFSDNIFSKLLTHEIRQQSKNFLLTLKDRSDS